MIYDDETLRKLKQIDHRQYVNTVFDNAIKSALEEEEPLPPEKDPFIKGMRMQENVDYDPPPKTPEQTFNEALEALLKELKQLTPKKKQQEKQPTKEQLSENIPDILDQAVAQT
jgi:DNA-binding transcriptional MerR regulator